MIRRSWHSCPAAMLVSALALAGVALPAGAPAGASRPTDAVVTARAADPTRLEALEIETAEPATLRARRQTVTDLALRILPVIDGVPVGVALAAANADMAVRGRGRDLFAVELTLVSGGRLVAGGQARCTAWVAQASHCRMACDGGAFLVARLPGPDGVRLRLLLGELAPGEAASGIRLAACSDRQDGAEHHLMPRRGSRVVEVELVRD